MSEHRRSLGVYEDVLNQLKAKGIRLTESRKSCYSLFDDV